MTRFSCSTHAFNLIAFLALLLAIVVLALAGTRADQAVLVGLVGVIGTFRPWSAAVAPEGPAGTTRDPIAVQGADDGKKPVATEPTDTA